MRLLRRAARVLSLIAAGLIASSSFSGPTGPTPVWLSDGSDVVRQLDPETHTVLRSLALPDDAGALAVDPYDHSLWVLTEEAQLLQFAAGGEPLRNTTLASYLDDDDATYQPVLNPYGGNLWVGAGKTLLRLNPQGTPDVHTRLPDVIRQLVLGFDETLWVLTQQELFSLSPAGQILSRHAFTALGFTGSDKPASLAVDVLGEALWLATPRTLARVDTGPNGTTLGAPVIVHTQAPPQPQFTSPLALNAFTGELWLATGDTLLAFSRQGAAVRSVDLAAHNLKKPRALVFEPQTQTLWLSANGGKIAQVAGSGALLGVLTVGAGNDDGRTRFGVMPAHLLPTVKLHAPAPGSRIDHAQPPIKLALGASCNSRPCDLGDDYLAAFTLNVTLDGAAIPSSAWTISGNTAVYTPGTLSEGTMDIEGTATDAFNHPSATFSSSFIIDLPPVITLTSPVDGTLTNQREQTLLGFVNEPVTLTLNGAPLVAPPPTQQFTQTLTLNEGVNTWQLVAIDSGNNRTEHVFTLRLDSTPPVAATAELGEIVEGNVGVAGTAEAGSTVTITNLRTGVATRVVAGADGTYSAQLAAQGGDVLRITVTDAAGNSSAATEAAISGGLPPDPARVAPPVDRTVASILATTTAFLYTGSNPIQTGVAPGTIEPKRAAVLRGKVLARDNTALGGVTITVQGHPEFGQTKSRADGMFDMAVNGGGYLTLDYSKTGFLPAQRQVHTPWQDFAFADEVVLIPLDSAVTTITANAPVMQVAQGNPVTDADGTRTATILFPAGTTATMTLPNGSTQTLATLNVRATEYTVGANGPKTMPGPLPPTSGYTYAVELSVDEAIAAGAKTVTFNQPVPVYVDNFLNFPVGGIVPVGWYDRDKAAWIPSANGRVIKILAVQNNQAQLDTNGDGLADDAARLAALGVTAAEQIQLAGLYAPGQTLWRVPVTHFTPWDCNWPRKPPPDATAPQQPEPQQADKPKDDPDCNGGSIIECQNQILGERLSVTGTPLSLNYRSDRVPGRKKNVLDIPLSGASLPSSLRRIELEIFVAGREFKYSFAVQPNQTYRFEWDGQDAYGRSLQGAQPVTVRIGYVYAAVYATAPEGRIAFAAFGGVPLSVNRARDEITVWQESTTTIGSVDARNQGLGGWTLSAHHAYDPSGQTLYLGDGSRRGAQGVNRIIDTVAGNSEYGFSGEGGPATAAQLYFPYGVAVDAQGNLYIADSSNHRTRRVAPDGIISTVAGNGYSGFSGDGGPATAASVSSPTGVAFDAQGNLYIAASQNRRIRRVTPEGLITTVAGNGGIGFSGDGGPATAAQLYFPYGVAVDAQGNLYIADSSNHRIRRVTPDGLISTVAGIGSYYGGFSGDGGPATAAQISSPTGVAVDAQGNLYIADFGNNRIRRVTPDGIISTVAGNGNRDFSGDGGPATATSLYRPFGVAVDAQGNLYITDTENHRIRKVTPGGIISTVAGNGRDGFSGDGGPATAAQFSYPRGVAVDAQGNLYIADSNNHRIRKIALPLPGFAGTDSAIPSADGTDLFHFDASGRHLRTLNAHTGATAYTFGYANGLLSQITDGDGDITRIERDGAGKATAIVAADGQRTALTLDANGYLASVANPANETHRMQYTADGLLTRFENPRGNASTMQYDAEGKLIRDENAAGGFWDLARSGTAKDYSVAMSSAEGRTTRYRIEELTTGDERRTNTAPDGTVSLSLRKTDGSTQNTSPDGTVTTFIEGPDPRWKMQAPLITSTSTKTPSGLTSAITTTRTAALTDANNPLSMTTETTTTTVNGRAFVTEYTASNRQYTFTSPQNRTRLLRTDAQNRPVFSQVPNIAAVNYAYDPRGRLTTLTQGSGADARAITWTYGADGFVERVTDAQNRAVLYQRDPAGRITQSTLPGSRVIGMVYDANGNVTGITPPAKPAHTFSYTPVDLAAQYTPPTVADLSTPATQYAYNRDKQITRLTRPDGQTVDVVYDTGGRLSALTPATAPGAATPPDAPVTYGYHATGQLASIATPTQTLAYTYDGFLPTSETFGGQITGTISRSYDNNFRTTQLGVNGSAIALGYDHDDLLITAGAMSFTRHAQNGLLTGTTLGNTTTTHSYNAFGELATFTANDGTSALLNDIYTYDTLGRITSKTEILAGVTDTWAYNYDLAGRLQTVTKNGVTVESYGYDANGNRLSHNGVAGTYDDQDRLLAYGANTYTWTANGELQTKAVGPASAGQQTHYTYDVYGNLQSVTLPDGTPITYLTDGRHRRIGKIVNGTRVQAFLYQDQLRITAELDGANNLVSRFVYGTKINVPEYMMKNGTTYRIVTDHLGSVRLVVNTTDGSVAQRMDYDSYGNVTSDTNPGFQPFGFAGGLYDRGTKLVRFGARDYDAETGRWTTKDPIGFAGGDSNLHAYVGNDPINFVDANGLAIVPQGTPAEVAQINSALTTLSTSSSTGANVINQLNQSSQTVSIVVTSGGNSYDPSKNVCKFNPTKTTIGSGKKPWETRPPEVGLGHELIHALHDVQGTLGKTRAQEENQTTGVGPYATSPITDNAIRSDYGLPARPHY